MSQGCTHGKVWLIHDQGEAGTRVVIVNSDDTKKFYTEEIHWCIQCGALGVVEKGRVIWKGVN
jgi:hypothetical protein